MRRKIDSIINRTKLAFDPGLSFGNALDLAVSSHPDEPVFRLDEEIGYAGLGSLDIAPRPLRSFVNKVSNVLQDAGVSKGDKVAVYKTNSPDYVFLGMSIVRASGISVPINGGMAIEGLKNYLQVTNATAFVTDLETFKSKLGSTDVLPMIKLWIIVDGDIETDGASAINLSEAILSASEEFVAAPLEQPDELIYVHTSGTTGFPKAVVSTCFSSRNGIQTLLRMPAGFGGVKSCVALPFNHLIAHTTLTTMLLAGWWASLISRDKAKRLLTSLQSRKAGVCFAFPDVYTDMYAENLDDYDLTSVWAWVAAADSSHEVHMREFCSRGASLRLGSAKLLSSMFVDPFGSSELGGPALVRFYFERMRAKGRRLVGRPVPWGPKVKVADAEGKKLRAFEVGRLMVKGGTLFKRYLNKPDNEPTFIDGWWWTGDLVYKDRFGRYFHMDRDADAINSEHGRVYSLPIEELMLTHSDILEATVVAVNNGSAEVPIAICILKEGVANTIGPDIKNWLNQRLEQSNRIHDLIVADAIPRGLTGKVLKRELRDKYYAANGVAREIYSPA